MVYKHPVFGIENLLDEKLKPFLNNKKRNYETIPISHKISVFPLVLTIVYRRLLYVYYSTVISIPMGGHHDMKF